MTPPVTELSTLPRVDLLPPSALALPGRLGLTRAPGRFWPGRSFDADYRLREDVDWIAHDHGAKLLVTLLERHEIAELGDLRGIARGAGLEWIHFPIADFSVPRDVGATRRLVERILASLARGEGVVVHCWGGLGRAGTIGACALVAHGLDPEQAIAVVRAVRPGAVQNAEQKRFVLEFGAAG